MNGWEMFEEERGAGRRVIVPRVWEERQNYPVAATVRRRHFAVEVLPARAASGHEDRALGFQQYFDRGVLVRQRCDDTYRGLDVLLI